MKEYCKCHFCCSYDEHECCEDVCVNYSSFNPSPWRIKKKAQEEGVSVSDVWLLIKLESGGI